MSARPHTFCTLTSNLPVQAECRSSVPIQRAMWHEITELSQANITVTMFLFSTLEIPHVQTRTIYCILLINTWICIWKIRAIFQRKQRLRNMLRSQQKQLSISATVTCSQNISQTRKQNLKCIFQSLWTSFQANTKPNGLQVRLLIPQTSLCCL